MLCHRYLMNGAAGCAVALTFGCVGLSAAPASQAAPRQIEDLRAISPASTPGALQVRLRWTTDEPTANPADTRNRFDPLSIEHLAVPVAAPRSTTVGPDTLVVVGEDADGRALSWRVIADPRLVRAESSSAPALSGVRLVYPETDLLLTLPDVAGTAQIGIYKTRAQDGRVVLDALGTVVIR